MTEDGPDRKERLAAKFNNRPIMQPEMFNGAKFQFSANRYLFSVTLLIIVVGSAGNRVASWAGAASGLSFIIGAVAAVAAVALYYRVSPGLRRNLRRRWDL